MKSMFEKTIDTIVNALTLADEEETELVEDTLRNSIDNYLLVGEDKYSSPEEAIRESRGNLISLTLSSPDEGREWRWARRLHDALREYVHFAYDASARLRRTASGIAVDIMKGEAWDSENPWYPADKTVTVDIILAGQRYPLDNVIGSLYQGLGAGENRRNVLRDIKSGPLMAVLSLMER